MDGFTIAYPEGAVVCAAGDYLICRRGAVWQVYRVEDILWVRRLLPLRNSPYTLMAEEHMLDSMVPAYSDDVQLLLTALAPDFSDASKALQSIRLQTLTEREKGLLRPAREFSEADCRVAMRS